MEETITEGPKRPQFLTVVCILTYIGVGIGILGSVGAWWGMRFLANMMEQHGGDLEGLPGMNDPAKIEQTMLAMKYSNVMLVSGILCSIICLVGALQMWKQKKMGFYIYLVGEIAPMIVSLSLMGASAFIGWGILGVAFPATFIVLYLLNLKHLS
jgi:hypothetical protein